MSNQTLAIGTSVFLRKNSVLLQANGWKRISKFEGVALSKKRLNKESYPSVLIYSFSRTGPSFGANQNAVIIEPIKTINGA